MTRWGRRSMADKGIIFSAPMVRALLDGRKSQTRRLLKGVPPAPSPDNVVHPHPRHEAPYFDAYCGGKKTAANPRGMTNYWCWWTRDDRCGHGCKVPYCPGERLYVREAFAERTALRVPDRIKNIVYRADLPDAEPPQTVPITSQRLRWVCAPKPWRSSRFMPRWASRLWLNVTDVRVQRLQDISEEDAIAEGIIEYEPTDEDPAEFSYVEGGDIWNNARGAYQYLWNSLHTKPGERWEDNPWIVAIGFGVNHGNIDRSNT